MLISVHIPKCAGTSFHLLLRACYGDRLCLNYGRAFHRGQARELPVPSQAACIHGHFLADTFVDRFASATLLTWVRDPVERVVSNYYHFLRAPDMRDECCRRLHADQLSLREFAELDWMRNTMTHYFAGLGLDDFAAVGVSEYPNESLALIRARLGWGSSGAILPHANVNPNRPGESYVLDGDTRLALQRLNEADQDLYATALDRLVGQPALVPVAA